MSYKLTEGMELWWVPTNQYRAKEAVWVVKVGRKWAALSNNTRVNVADLQADGGGYSSPGKAWLTQADYESHMDIVVAWRDLRNDIAKLWVAPDGVGVSAINDVRRLIGLEVVESRAALPNTTGEAE